MKPTPTLAESMPIIKSSRAFGLSLRWRSSLLVRDLSSSKLNGTSGNGMRGREEVCMSSSSKCEEAASAALPLGVLAESLGDGGTDGSEGPCPGPPLLS